VTLTLTTDDPSGPCGAVGDSMTITINAVATVNAGLDQLIQAGGTATLAGSKGGGATSATWSGGGGAFSPDNMTLNAIYTPSQAEVDAGEVTLTLTTDDPAGPCPAANDSVLIDINRPPVANVAAYDCTRGLSVKILVTGLLSSSTSDVDGDARSLTSVGAAGNGTATVVNGYIVYSNNGSGVSDSFAYNISDGRGGSASASINITIVEPSEQSQNKLSDPQVIGGGPDVRLRFLGIPGYQYALEWTHDLTPIVTWTPLQTNQADVTGLVTYTNTPSGMADYYRTRWVP
jgi:hypothetical protein